jgi:four helix bundle protein
MIIKTHYELIVYRMAYTAAMEIFQLSKGFPIGEQFSLTDQIRRASRAVCANTAEGWRRRKYPAAFVAKLSDAETEAAETQTWLDFARYCKYLPVEVHDDLFERYDQIIGKLVNMSLKPQNWTF